jgi:hypothetical protein
VLNLGLRGVGHWALGGPLRVALEVVQRNRSLGGYQFTQLAYCGAILTRRNRIIRPLPLSGLCDLVAPQLGNKFRNGSLRLDNVDNSCEKHLFFKSQRLKRVYICDSVTWEIIEGDKPFSFPFIVEQLL